VPKNGGTTIWEKNRGDPSFLFQQGRPCVKVMVFVLIKGKSSSGISIHPAWRFWKNHYFHPKPCKYRVKVPSSMLISEIAKIVIFEVNLDHPAPETPPN
jgi:hypothetical protein